MIFFIPLLIPIIIPKLAKDYEVKEYCPPSQVYTPPVILSASTTGQFSMSTVPLEEYNRTVGFLHYPKYANKSFSVSIPREMVVTFGHQTNCLIQLDAHVDPYTKIAKFDFKMKPSYQRTICYNYKFYRGDALVSQTCRLFDPTELEINYWVLYEKNFDDMYMGLDQMQAIQDLGNKLLDTLPEVNDKNISLSYTLLDLYTGDRNTCIAYHCVFYDKEYKYKNNYSMYNLLGVGGIFLAIVVITAFKCMPRSTNKIGTNSE